MMTNTKITRLSVNIDFDVKEKLQELAKIKGMDLSKIVRASLTNMVKPGTYSL